MCTLRFVELCLWLQVCFVEHPMRTRENAQLYSVCGAFYMLHRNFWQPVLLLLYILSDCPSNCFSHGLWANTLLTGWLKKINLLQPVSANSFCLLMFIEFTLFIPFYFQPFLETELGVSADNWATPCSTQWTGLFTGVVWSFACKEITLCWGKCLGLFISPCYV